MKKKLGMHPKSEQAGERRECATSNILTGERINEPINRPEIRDREINK